MGAYDLFYYVSDICILPIELTLLGWLFHLFSLQHVKDYA